MTLNVEKVGGDDHCRAHWFKLLLGQVTELVSGANPLSLAGVPEATGNISRLRSSGTSHLKRRRKWGENTNAPLPRSGHLPTHRCGIARHPRCHAYAGNVAVEAVSTDRAYHMLTIQSSPNILSIMCFPVLQPQCCPIS